MVEGLRVCGGFVGCRRLRKEEGRWMVRPPGGDFVMKGFQGTQSESSGEQCSEQSWEMCSWGCDRRRDLYSISARFLRGDGSREG